MSVTTITYKTALGREATIPVSTRYAEALAGADRKVIRIYHRLLDSFRVYLAARERGDTRSVALLATHGEANAYAHTLSILVGHTSTYWTMDLPEVLNTPVSEYV